MIVDLTGIACSFIAGFFGVLSVAVPSIVDRHLRRQQARDVLRYNIRASVGILQQASTVAGQMLSLGGEVPEVPSKLEPAVRFVLQNAGAEADLLGISPEGIARRILAQVGLMQIKTNQAVAGSSAPVVPDPLGPLATVSSLAQPIGPSSGTR